MPFFVAVPGPTIDWTLAEGSGIAVEERPAREVTHIHGLDSHDQPAEVRLAPSSTLAANPAFDVTPARLVTALVTERGVCPATTNGLRALYPELAPLPPAAPNTPELPP